MKNKDFEELPVITSYLERLSEEAMQELSDGKGDEDAEIQQ